MSKLIDISKLSKLLNLVNPETKKPLNHILRYWEKEFKIIKPKKINNRRYYSSKQVKIVKMIKFLLKNKGMTISGVKKLTDLNINQLDDRHDRRLKAENFNDILKLKTKIIIEKLDKIKKYGKKNTS